MSDRVRPALINLHAFCAAYVGYVKRVMIKQKSETWRNQVDGLAAVEIYFTKLLAELPETSGSSMSVGEVARLELIVLEKSNQFTDMIMYPLSETDACDVAEYVPRLTLVINEQDDARRPVKTS